MWSCDAIVAAGIIISQVSYDTRSLIRDPVLDQMNILGPHLLDQPEQAGDVHISTISKMACHGEVRSYQADT